MCYAGRESRGTREIAEQLSKNITGFARQVGQGTTDRGTVNGLSGAGRKSLKKARAP